MLGSWLSDFQDHRIFIRKDKHSPYRPHRDRWETRVDGRWLRVKLCDDHVLSAHRNGKITNTELYLIHECQSAVEIFAHGTAFNLYWGTVWKRDWIEVNSPSTDDMRSFFEGEPDGAVRLLTETQKEALQTIARCRHDLGLDRKPEAERVHVPIKWAQLFYPCPFGYTKRPKQPAPFFVLPGAASSWRCDEFEPLIAAPPLQPSGHEFVPIVSNATTQRSLNT